METMEKNLADYTAEENARQENSGQQAPDNRKPQFNVKMNGNYVGRGWLQEGKYGKYVSLSVNQDVPAGSKVYISPNKYNDGLLG